MTVQLEYFVEVCVLLKYLNAILYMNVWALIIRASQLSEHIQGPMSLEGPLYNVIIRLASSNPFTFNTRCL